MCTVVITTMLMHREEFLKPEHARTLPGGSGDKKTDSVFQVGLGVCISDKLPDGAAAAAALGPHFE